MVAPMLKPLPDVDERCEAFLIVAEWSRDDLPETAMLPADEYVAVVVRQLYDIIAEDDERGRRAWDAICALCSEYKLAS